MKTKEMFAASILTVDGDFFYFLADVMAESVQYGFQIVLCDTFVNASKHNENLVDTFATYTKNVFYKFINRGCSDYRFVASAVGICFCIFFELSCFSCWFFVVPLVATS